MEYCGFELAQGECSVFEECGESLELEWWEYEVCVCDVCVVWR